MGEFSGIHSSAMSGGGGGGDWRASTDSHMLVSPVLTFHT